jgi:hypothetical protein
VAQKDAEAEQCVSLLRRTIDPWSKGSHE